MHTPATRAALRKAIATAIGGCKGSGREPYAYALGYMIAVAGLDDEPWTKAIRGQLRALQADAEPGFVSTATLTHQLTDCLENLDADEPAYPSLFGRLLGVLHSVDAAELKRLAGEHEARRGARAQGRANVAVDFGGAA